MTSYRRRAQDTEAGFTLIELLVVILIIGILAAIALPSYLGQREKGQDSEAKQNARNLVSEIESCYVQDATYVGCTATLTPGETGLPIGAGAGQARIVAEAKEGYEIEAVSKATTGGTAHTFTIIHNIGGIYDRTCTVAGEGGCGTDGHW